MGGSWPLDDETGTRVGHLTLWARTVGDGGNATGRGIKASLEAESLAGLDLGDLDAPAMLYATDEVALADAIVDRINKALAKEREDTEAG